MGIVIFDFLNKIFDVLSVYIVPCALFAVVLALVARFAFRKRYGFVSLWAWVMFGSLIFCETIIRRIGTFKATTDWFGVRELFENPWFVVAAVENVIMFAPLGFFGCLAFRRLQAGRRLWINIGVALCLSVAVEVIQFCMQIGEAQVMDVVTNILGCVIGYVIGVFIVHKLCRID